MLVKTSDLSRGERLLVKRRREAMSQVDAAERFRVSLYHYRGWETDTRECPHEVAVGRLELFEQCFILRRRSGLRMRKIAGKIGVSRWWVCQMERGEVDARRLVSFWRDQ